MVLSSLPDCFTDEEVCRVLRVQNLSNACHAYPLTFGLAIKLRTGLIRVQKRTYWKWSERVGTDEENLFLLVSSYTNELDTLRELWTAQTLWDATVEVALKATNLSNELYKELCDHSLTTRSPNSGMLQFDRTFLRKVKSYHASVLRLADLTASVVGSSLKSKINEEEKDDGRLNAEPLVIELARLPREHCCRCNGRKQVYCGECGGLRLPAAAAILPDRIKLPFDILLLLHW